ncbi:MAG: UDP-N-acetylmuramoyl-L-alanyl-D-glutamate--2,6-diaminopimelate ligase [Lentisphaerota bacterium]
MKMDKIARVIQAVSSKGSHAGDVEGLAYDSRMVRPGFLFIALPGERHDGRDFLEDALQRGAVAVVSEEKVSARKDLACFTVKDARLAMAQLACAFYDHPSRRMDLAGVTGTNGKSTTVFMIRDILRAQGRNPGLIGTIQYEIGGRCIPASRTTPEAPDIQSLLDQMLRAGCESAAMEVSSHGLMQKRTWGLDFNVGVFTNLTQDHLDFHETMEQYFEAKKLLFEGLGKGRKKAFAVVNLDDESGRRLAADDSLSARLVTFGASAGAMVRAERISCSAQGSTFDLVTPWGEAPMRLKMLGRFNVSNALAAIATGGSLGAGLELMASTLASMPHVRGRLEPVDNERDLLIFVDYAHTDDALANVLQTLREITRNRLILVFGCGGHRDKAKRPLMGAVAARMADYSIVTSDNPRNEDPMEIVAHVASGFGFSTNFEMEVDRAKAIARALELAREGDTVLIAGKGHENYQEFANTVIPFDDRDAVEKVLNNK